MSRLESLLKEAQRGESQVAEYDAKIASLQAQLRALESHPINIVDIDTADEAAVLALSSRKLRIEVLPQQITGVDRQKGDALRALAATADLIRREIAELCRTEKEKVAAEIAEAIKGYYLSDGASFAWQWPIMVNMSAAAAVEGRPRGEDNFKREESDQCREQFDSVTIAFVNEATAVAERYLATGTFVPAAYLRKKR